MSYINIEKVLMRNTTSVAYQWLSEVWSNNFHINALRLERAQRAHGALARGKMSKSLFGIKYSNTLNKQR